jgi:hypothetical protein
MNKLRQLAPWPIIALAVVTLIIIAIVAYFVVAKLTTSGHVPQANGTVPGDLGGKRNQQVIDKLGKFSRPRDLPIVPEQLRTPNPNAPVFSNPFGS